MGRMLVVLWRAFVVLLLLGVQAEAQAQEATSVSTWLMRLHQASQHSTYTGIFVVSAGTQMSSARIWHVCEVGQQIERIDALSGTPRATLRKNEEVLTLYPAAKVAIAETQASFGLFPGLLKSPNTTLDVFYSLKPVGSGRVAGQDADVVHITPRDGMRYGYKVWSEKKTGLVLQLQTMDADGKTLEQAAFSELQLDATVQAAQLMQMMGQTEGYRIERRSMEKTTASAQGWIMGTLVPGFQSVGSYLRPVALLSGVSGASDVTLQWIFSDGLANVSLFVQKYDAQRHQLPGAADFGGATRAHTRRLGGWWITAVGEVPAPTLQVFVGALERKK